MRNLIIITVIVAAFLLTTLIYFDKELPNNQSQAPVEKAEAEPSVSQTGTHDGDDSKVVLGVFEGKIPCADCERIKMELTLYQDPATHAATTYSLTQVYVGKSDERFTQTGTWDYLRGNDEDPNATIYGLNLDKPKDDQMYFLKVGDNKITMIDRNMNPIKSSLNYTLVKQ